jgi:hypothetical protein
VSSSPLGVGIILLQKDNTLGLLLFYPSSVSNYFQDFSAILPKNSAAEKKYAAATEENIKMMS